MTRKQWIEFLQAHSSAWSSNAVAIGLTAAEVTTLLDALTDTQQMLTAAEEKRLQAKEATATYYDQADQMARLGQQAIDRIRLFAQTTNNPNVLVIAQLPPVAPPQPLGAPTVPTDFVASINQDGFLTLAWKSSNAANSSGAFFNISRQINGEGAFAPLGAVPGREFIDTTIPVGTGQVGYRVQGRRGAFLSDPAYYTVRFGAIGPGGLMITGQGEGLESKLAA
jgi:hypothetical protein